MRVIITVQPFKTEVNYDLKGKATGLKTGNDFFIILELLVLNVDVCSDWSN